MTTAEKQERAQERRAELRAELEKQVAALVESDEWRKWLDCRAVFHDYSFGNVMLLLSQSRRRDVSISQVAGFHAWKKVGRAVRKGESAFWVWAPMLVKTRDDEQPETIGKDGKGRRMIFRPVPVFDISQTDGEPLPELKREPITGDTPGAELIPRLIEWAGTELGYKVEFADAGELGGAGGDCSETTKRIRLLSGQAPNRTARTLLHELAHAQGAFYSRWPGDDGEGDRFPRDVCEVMVESAAYVAAGAAGLDTSAETVGYVAGWADGKVERIKAVAGKVDELARALEAACGIGKETGK